jgi:hypothetical protein
VIFLRHLALQEKDENILHHFLYRKRLPIGYKFHISIVFQATSDTMLVPVMSDCMSASNKIV